MAIKSPFQRWVESEGVPVIRGYNVEDLLEVKVEPWKRKGGLGAIIILEGGQGWNYAYVCEIPPGAKLNPERHLFEEQIYVLTGQGESEFWNDTGSRQKISWRGGSLFAAPLNAWHDYRNTGSEPARYVAVSNAPVVLNLFNDPEAVFNCSFNFKERYSGEADYFNPEGKQGKEIGAGTDRPVWRVNFIPNVHASKLGETPMGTGMSLVQLNLSGNSMAAHIAELEVGTYKKAHRHQAGAHIIWLSGRGYTFLWSERGEQIRIDWKKHSLINPPENWYHQHFNVSPEPARHVALRRGLPGVGRKHKPWLDAKQGGDQIEYEDEQPDVRHIYEAELKKAGIPCQMPPVSRKVG